MTKDEAVTEVLDRLADKENKIWSRSEITDYFKDGLDEFCHRSKCLWDIWVIPNISPTGNWTTDLELYYAQNTAGFGHTDERLNFTAEDERGKPTGDAGQYQSGQAQPVVGTRQGDMDFKSDFTNLTTTTTQVKGGSLPQTTVAISRVAYDRRTLTGISSQRMRELDPRYEIRAGEPQWFIWDKDGLFYLRVVPAAQGNAAYDTVEGSRGTITQTSETVTFGSDERRGVLRDRSDWFPAGGPHGSPTQIHPEDLNTKVEYFRLNRDLDSYGVEIPSAYRKYPIFWAMYRALERIGPGQDQQLADHFKARFEVGVGRIEKKVREMDKERAGRLGGVSKMTPFGLGDPVPPYPYGVPF